MSNAEEHESKPKQSRRKTVTHEEFATTTRHLESIFTTTTRSLDDKIEKVADSVDKLADSQDKFQNSIYSELRATTRPQYANWIAAGSLFLAFLVLIGALYNSRETGLRTEMKLLHEAGVAHTNRFIEGNDRYSEDDARREKEAQEERERFREEIATLKKLNTEQLAASREQHKDELLLEWQRRQDDAILANTMARHQLELENAVNDAKSMEHRRHLEKMQDSTLEWIRQDLVKERALAVERAERLASLEEWKNVTDDELKSRGEWMSKEQEKINRLDERARYHIELDDPTDVRPRDVLNELQRQGQDEYPGRYRIPVPQERSDE